MSPPYNPSLSSSRLNRLPLRLRVTLAFSGAMALVLAAMALFIYLRLGTELDATIEQGLRSRAGDVSALVAQADSGLAESGRSPLTERGENLAQILDAQGHVVDSTPLLRNRALLNRQQLAAAARQTIIVKKVALPGGDGDTARLLATPVSAQGTRLVVVVGASLEDREQAVRNLGGLLLIGCAVALLLASLAGYGAAAGALRPVERMRRRAAAIQHAGPAERLPVPPGDDEIGRLGHTLNEMLARLETSFERERAFVADASHELRTPLAILKTEIELALRDGRSVEEFKDALRSAGEETDRLVQLAEDLLVIARSDQGRLPIRHEEVDLQELLGAVRSRFLVRARDHGADIAVLPAPAVTALADSLRLEQALGNLLDNALRHGGRRVSLQAIAMDEVVELHVRDDGPGFPAGFLGRAFERFARADAARGRGGAGLGLAIVSAIASAHGGSAAAANRPDGGADVWLVIPRRP
jgi:two-component system OmpR family sensor kinase